MSILSDNKLLQVTEQEIERKLTPQTKEAYDRIVIAGMKVALEPGPNNFAAGLMRQEDPVSAAAIGAINLVLMMSKQSKGKMPDDAMVYAAFTMMLLALDFADRTGLVKVGEQELVKAQHVFTNQWFKAVNVSPDRLQQMATKTNEIVQDPAKMRKLQEQAGQVKAGGAE